MIRFGKTKLPCTHNIKLTTLQKWIASSVHHHIPLWTLLNNHESGFCGSLSQTLCKPWVVLLLSCIGVKRAWYAMKGWLMFVIFSLEWQGRSNRIPNWTSGFQSSLYSILYSYIEPTLHPPPTTPITTTCNIITLTKKSYSKQLEFWVVECYSQKTHTHKL